MDEKTAEEKTSEGSLCWQARVMGEYSFLVKMWFNKGKFTARRKKPIDPLIYNHTVLMKSQGRSYPWWN